jgi:hypothetical protein
MRCQTEIELGERPSDSGCAERAAALNGGGSEVRRYVERYVKWRSERCGGERANGETSVMLQLGLRKNFQIPRGTEVGWARVAV